jgi:hypothetical protein
LSLQHPRARETRSHVHHHTFHPTLPPLTHARNSTSP